MRRHRAFALILFVACERKETKIVTPDAPLPMPSATESASAPIASASTAPMPSASAPAPASSDKKFPLPVDVACATDDDCTTTSLWSGNCCGTCELRYANKSWASRATAYCTAHPPASCPPMGCSWGMGAAQCRDKKCQAFKR